MRSSCGSRVNGSSRAGSSRPISAQRLPFADGSFDTTICFDVLEHVADDGQTIRELARVTRRRLVLAVPQADQWMWR